MNEYEQYLLINNKIRLLEPFRGAKEQTSMQCCVCDHIWTATPVSKKQTFKKHGATGCPKCHTNKKTTTKQTSIHEIIRILKERGYELQEEFQGKSSRDFSNKTLIKRLECGHSWKAVPHQIAYNNVICKICNNDNKSKRLQQSNEQKLIEWRHTRNEWQVYKRDVMKLTEITYRNNKSKINPLNKPRGRAGQKGAYQIDHVISVRFCFENNVPVELCASADNIQMLHWKDNVEKRDHISYLHMSTDIRQFLNEHNTSVQQQFISYVSEMMNEKNIKFLIKENVIVIGDCGFYLAAFQDFFQTNKHVYNKAQQMQQEFKHIHNIELNILWEDEWRFHKNKIIQFIKHKTHCTDNTRIHARLCSIKRILDTRERTVFLNDSHIQGTVRSDYCYGAYFNNTLVGIITFNLPRKMNHGLINKEGTIELSRFAINKQYRIPGLMSKMINHFWKTEGSSFNSIFSYADRRISIGNLYSQTGFVEEKVNPPSYKYVINGVRKHRWSFRKDVLKNTYDNYNEHKTEYEMMLEQGIDRVWDCGTIRYIKYKV